MDSELAAIDAEIEADRRLYLRAVWAGHDGEATAYEFRVDELKAWRDIVVRRLVPERTRGQP